MNDVIIRYYEASSKGHDLGYILFANDMDKLLDTDRIEVDATTNHLFFRKPAPGKKGLKVSGGKIQLWALARIAKEWEGEYPLVFDVKADCYCVNLTDCSPIDYTGVPQLGTKVTRPKKKKEVEEVKLEPVVEEVPATREEAVEEINNKIQEAVEHRAERKNVFINERPAKYVSDQYRRKQTTEIYLKNKVLDLTLAGRSEDAQILAKAFRIISMEIE